MSAIASQITSITIVYWTVDSDADQRKHKSSASLGFWAGNSPGTGEFPHKWPVTRKIFPFDDIMWMLSHTAPPMQFMSWSTMTKFNLLEWFNICSVLHISGFSLSILCIILSFYFYFSISHHHNSLYNKSQLNMFIFLIYDMLNDAVNYKNTVELAWPAYWCKSCPTFIIAFHWNGISIIRKVHWYL